MTPGEYKSSGAGLSIRYGIHYSPFGKCLIATTDRGICNLSFVDGSEGKVIDALVALIGALLVPAAQAPLKPNDVQSGVEDRLATGRWDDPQVERLQRKPPARPPVPSQ